MMEKFSILCIQMFLKKKSDLVVGEYEIEIPKKKCQIAIKITDMLGEEILSTKEI